MAALIGFLSVVAGRAQVFDLTIDGATYTSGQTIIEDAANHITTSGSVVVQSGSNITFTAGLSIKLEPGFQTQGATFRAYIGTQADSDEDGMPDVWEVAHGLDPNNPADASADPDGDGLSNLLEYRLGTDPNSAATTDNSTPQLKILTPQ